MGMGALCTAKKPLWLHSICNPLIAATHVIRIVVQMRALLVNAGVVGSTSPQRLTNHDQIVCGSIFFCASSAVAVFCEPTTMVYMPLLCA